MPSHKPNKYKEKLSSVVPEIDFDAGWDAIEQHLDEKKEDKKPLLWWRIGVLTTLVIAGSLVYVNEESQTHTSVDMEIPSIVVAKQQREQMSSSQIASSEALANASVDQTFDTQSNVVESTIDLASTITEESSPRNRLNKQQVVASTLTTEAQTAVSEPSESSFVAENSVSSIASQETRQTTLIADQAKSTTAVEKHLGSITLLPTPSLRLLTSTGDDLVLPSFFISETQAKQRPSKWSLGQRMYTQRSASTLMSNDGFPITTSALLSALTNLQYNKTIHGRWSWIVGAGYQVQRRRQNASTSTITIDQVSATDGTVVINDTGSIIGTLPGQRTRETVANRAVQQYNYIHTAVLEAGISLQWSDRWSSELTGLYSMPLATRGNAINETQGVVPLNVADLSAEINYQASLLYALPMPVIHADVGITTMISGKSRRAQHIGLQLRVFL